MKKALSTALAASLVVSSFASVAFAAETAAPATTQEKYDALFALKIFEGDDTGANLGGDMTRAQLAKIITLVKGLTEDASAATYTDLDGATWATGYIGAVTKAGIFDGVAEGKFDPSGKVTLEQLAKVLTIVLGLPESTDAVSGTVSDWAKGYVAAAVKAGLLSETDYTVNATRGEFVDSTYTAVTAIQQDLAVASAKAIDTNTVEFTLSNGAVITKKLETALVANKETEVTVSFLGKELTAKVTLAATLELTKAEAVGAKKVAVTFNGAVDTTKVVATLKNGTSTVTTTATWNDDKNVLTLERSANLAAGDYTVTITGVDLATGKDTASFEVEAEYVAKVELEEKAYISAEDEDANTVDVEVGYKVFNQYNEDITDGADLDTLVVTTSKGESTENPADEGTIEITGVDEDEDNIIITLVNIENGKNDKKTVAVVEGKKVAEITLGQPVLKDEDTVVYDNDTYEITYTAKDQYGNDYELTEDDVVNLTFISSDDDYLNDEESDAEEDHYTNITVDGDNKLNVKFEAFEGPQEVTLTAIVKSTGASSKTTFTVNGDASPAEVKLVAPEGKFGLGDELKVEIQVTDEYGELMDADDVATLDEEFTITSSRTSRFGIADDAIIEEDDKAYVVLVSDAEGSTGAANLNVTVDATGKTASLSITVVDAKYASELALKTEDDITKAVYADGKAGIIKLTADLKDQYGEDFEFKLDEEENVINDQVVKFDITDDAEFTATFNDEEIDLDGYEISAYDLQETGIEITPTNDEVTVSITAELYDVDAEDVVNEDKVTLKSVATDEDLTFYVDAVELLYGQEFEDDDARLEFFKKSIELKAKDSSGNKVAISQELITEVKGNSKVAVVNDVEFYAQDDVDADSFLNVIYSDNAGEPQTLVVSVKISDDEPTPVSIEAKQDGDVVTSITLDVDDVIAVADLFEENGVVWFDINDQYGTSYLQDEVAVYVKDADGINELTGDYTISADKADDDGYIYLYAYFGNKTATVKVKVDE